MKTKIMNWLENHETIYGVGLLFVSIASVAFGSAYLGASMATTNNTVNVNICPMVDVASKETK